MPVARKPDHLRQRGGRTRAVGVVARDGEAVVPEMPVGRWLQSSREAWERLHRSEIAAVIQPLDGELLLHWLRCIDERERAYRAFRRQRFVEGSKGQPRLSPAWKLYQELSAEIRLAEQQLGIGGLNRFRLGVTLGQATAALNSGMDFDDEPEMVDIGGDVIEAVAR